MAIKIQLSISLSPNQCIMTQHAISMTNTGSMDCTSNMFCLEGSHLKQSSHIIHTLLPARNNPTQQFIVLYERHCVILQPYTHIPKFHHHYVELKMDQREGLDLFGPVYLQTRSKQTPLGFPGEQTP